MITHVLKKTDTLEGISVKYNVSIAKIKKINKIWNNSILLCMDKILIPEEDVITSPTQSRTNSIYSGIGNKNTHDLDSTANTNNNTNNNIYSPFTIVYSESAPNSPIVKSPKAGSISSFHGYSNRMIKEDDSLSESLNYYDNINSSSPLPNTKSISKSTSELTSLNELFESIDKSVMDSVNKNKITLPLLIKNQLEVYQDIPIDDPSKNKVIHKSYSIGGVDENIKKSNLNSPSCSSSTFSFHIDGYTTDDCISPAENRKSFLRQKQEKVNRIIDRLSISTKMESIHNFVSLFSARELKSSLSESSKDNLFKQTSNYMELAKIV